MKSRPMRSRMSSRIVTRRQGQIDLLAVPFDGAAEHPLGDV